MKATTLMLVRQFDLEAASLIWCAPDSEGSRSLRHQGVRALDRRLYTATGAPRSG